MPFSSPSVLPNKEIEPVSPVPLALARGFFTTEPLGKPPLASKKKKKKIQVLVWSFVCLEISVDLEPTEGDL